MREDRHEEWPQDVVRATHERSDDRIPVKGHESLQRPSRGLPRGLVRDWVSDFMEQHKALFNPPDWPDDLESYARGWIAAFATLDPKPTHDEALAASASLAIEPPDYLREHIPMVVAAIKAARERRGEGCGGAAPGSLDEAKAALERMGGCFGPEPEVSDTGEIVGDRGLGCGGSGFAVRWHPRPDPARKIGPTLVGYCTCPVGRWIKRQHAERSPELKRCYLDLADEEMGANWWRFDPPSGYTCSGYSEGFVPRRPDWLPPYQDERGTIQ